MRAAVVAGPGRLSVERVPDPAPRDHEVIVEVGLVVPAVNCRREITIKGSFSQAYSFDRALRMLRTERVRTDGMITDRFGLDGYGEALAAVAGDSGCLKAVVEP